MADDNQHTLPVELIRKVLLLACDDSSAIPSFLLICRAVHTWMLPLLYFSVQLTTSAQLSKFLSTHDIPNDLLESRFALVRNLYIGEAPSEQGDLAYGSTTWPLTILCRLLWLCRSVKKLTILNLDQTKWYMFTHAMPASLEYLTLGPVHGSFRPQALKQLPTLKAFTSVLTYMRDDEVQDIVCYPSMRVLRRILDGSSMAPHWAVEQVGCISKSPALERLEIVIFGRPAYTSVAASVVRDELKVVTKDPRVMISEDCRSWLDIVYAEFEEYWMEYLASMQIRY
ncbi:hypothetical protein CPB84DRAFT_1774434 [Gymnopilus junonius]|uniref:Uncharacterized protein n=1 Tax=Gymnopilus junonius TaxID=109634 RepID=A0A9P5NQU7_GYMJU|nr:hypothetical protein CPB84DRAFT_1774434 [Gymnopilus junonius]